VTDLYCPGYDPKQALAEDSNLASAAARYKIDTAKLASDVRMELSAKKEKEGADNPLAKTAKKK
jgi:hypothetical protein